jgi:SPP1 family predicted phage head-tail adaptor
MGLTTFVRSHSATQLRGLAWLALNETAVIQSQTLTSDSGGGATQAWAGTATCACRIDPAGGAPGVSAGRISETATHIVTTPSSAPVSEDSRLVIAGRGTFEISLVRMQTDQPDVTQFETVQTS